MISVWTLAFGENVDPTLCMYVCKPIMYVCKPISVKLQTLCMYVNLFLPFAAMDFGRKPEPVPRTQVLSYDIRLDRRLRRPCPPGLRAVANAIVIVVLIVLIYS